MDKKSKELAINMLKETNSYKYERVDYKELDEEVRIWSKSVGTLFFEIDLIVMYNDIFNMFLVYNAETERVELVLCSKREH
jgi:hypothetical protein